MPPKKNKKELQATKNAKKKLTPIQAFCKQYNITEDEQIAMQLYTSGMFRWMNGVMRGNLNEEQMISILETRTFNEFIATCELSVQGMKKLPSSHESHFYRGVNDFPLPGSLQNSNGKEYKYSTFVGLCEASLKAKTPFFDIGVMSTSKDSPFDREVLVIVEGGQAFKQHGGKDIQKFSKFANEGEVAFIPCSKFQVTDIYKNVSRQNDLLKLLNKHQCPHSIWETIQSQSRFDRDNIFSQVVVMKVTRYKDSDLEEFKDAIRKKRQEALKQFKAKQLSISFNFGKTRFAPKPKVSMMDVEQMYKFLGRSKSYNDGIMAVREAVKNHLTQSNQLNGKQIDPMAFELLFEEMLRAGTIEFLLDDVKVDPFKRVDELGAKGGQKLKVKGTIESIANQHGRFLIEDTKDGSLSVVFDKPNRNGEPISSSAKTFKFLDSTPFSHITSKVNFDELYTEILEPLNEYLAEHHNIKFPNIGKLKRALPTFNARKRYWFFNGNNRIRSKKTFGQNHIPTNGNIRMAVYIDDIATTGRNKNLVEVVEQQVGQE